MKTSEESSAVSISEKDQREILEIYKKIQSAEAKLIGPDGKTQMLPPNLYSFLCRLLGDLKAGKSVTLLQSNVQLTTVEAAKLLVVSRQFFVGLLERGEIPHHMVGTHRRVYARDVLAFKARRDSARRKTLDDLSKDEMKEGLYKLRPDDDRMLEVLDIQASAIGKGRGDILELLKIDAPGFVELIRKEI